MRAFLILFSITFSGSLAKPQIPGIKLPSIFGDDCDKALDRFARSEVCAVVFDEDDCDTGSWLLDLKEGYTELGSRGLLLKNDDSRKDDVESIVVRAGCVAVGYQKHDKNPLERGQSVAFDASKLQRPLEVKELEEDGDVYDELFEKIDAFECHCGAAAKRVTNVKPLTSLGDQGLTKKVLGNKKNLRQCNGFINDFNLGKVDGNKTVCALLFDEENCDYDASALISPGFKIAVAEGYTALPRLKRNDVESILVRPGCTLTGYDHADKVESKRGQTATFSKDTADNKKRKPDEPIFKNLKDNNDLREKISSVKCTC